MTRQAALLTKSGTRRLPRALAAGVLLVAWPLSSARAQPSDVERRTVAEELFAQATTLQAQGDYERACGKFAEVTRLQPGKIGALLALGECYEAAGKVASARTTYEAAERAAGAAADPRAARMRARVAELSPRIARLSIVVPAAMRGLKGLAITRDALDVGEPQWGEALPVDPGRHAVTAAAPGKKAWSAQVELPASGGTVVVDIPSLEDVPATSTAHPPEVPQPPVQGSRGAPAWAWIAGGAGLASLGVAAGFGADALSATAALTTHCGQDYGSAPCKETTKTYDPTADNARKNRGLGMLIGFGGAGVLALGAAVVAIARAQTAKASRTGVARVIPAISASGAFLTVEGGF